MLEEFSVRWLLERLGPVLDKYSPNWLDRFENEKTLFAKVLILTQESKGLSIEERARKYQEAYDKLVKIITHYTSTELARRIREGETINEVNFREVGDELRGLNEQIRQQIKEKLNDYDI